MVSAWISENGLVLGWNDVDRESNKISAVPELLDTLEIVGCIVTLDAIHCQTDTAQTIVENGADYVLPVKENQPRLLEVLQRLFEDPEELRWVECGHHQVVNKGQGGLETRECWSISDPDYLKYITTWGIIRNKKECSTIELARRSIVPEDRSNMIGYLQMVDIFQDLTEAEIEEIVRATTITTCRRGKIFYMPEDTSEVLFLLKEGRVQLYRISPDGKKLVMTTVGPGTVFGEMALIGQGMHNTFAEATEDCVLCVMSRGDVERLLVTKPKVALRLFEALGSRLKDTETRLEEIAFKGIPARLASLLLQLASEPGGDTITGLTHQDLGEQIGTYRETTTQTLNAFKADGLIDIGRKRITILDREGLQRLAES